MEPELQEFRSGKKSLELICYIAGAGAFGVFLRWMQLQLGNRCLLNFLQIPHQHKPMYHRSLHPEERGLSF